MAEDKMITRMISIDHDAKTAWKRLEKNYRRLIDGRNALDVIRRPCRPSSRAQGGPFREKRPITDAARQPVTRLRLKPVSPRIGGTH